MTACAVRLHRAALALASGALLASCQLAPPPPRPPPAASANGPGASGPALLAPQPGATLLTIDGAASRIELRLAAAGPLAGLGHPHVIVVRGLTGQVLVPSDLVGMRFGLRFSVEQMAVDEAADRAAAGGEFAPPIPDSARAGTREHMLGTGQLEALAHPQVVLRAQALHVSKGDAAAGEGELSLVVEMVGRSVPLTVPVHWQRTAQVLAAHGEFTLLQTALGIQPYSIGGGALRVADQMQVRYSISAR